MSKEINITSPSIGNWVLTRNSLWQLAFQDASGLDGFSRERGIQSFFSGDFLRKLWRLGAVSASLIESSEELQIEGLISLDSTDKSMHYYSDDRTVPALSEGWADVFQPAEEVPKSIRLHFHPFSFYVLYHIGRILKPSISPLQILVSTDRYSTLLHQSIDRFRRFTSSAEFAKNVQSWNQASKIAIACEPCFSDRIFGSVRYSPDLGYEGYRRLVDEHWEEIAPILTDIGLDRLEEHRRDICLAAESLDPNKDIHILMRFASSTQRLKRVRGRLGGSMCLLAMAEVIRRASEKAFQVKLREEDELGFGMLPHGVKENQYGSERLHDGDTSVKLQWLRSYGLDSGVRIRWYVEGDTEFYALEGAIGRHQQIELINLRGQVSARGGKGLAFRDSLRSDIKSMIFSLVSIDNDRSDYRRAAKKAAEDDEIVGMVFFSDPDFEFYNFSISELEELIWELCVERGAADDQRSELHLAIDGSQNADELIVSAKNAIPQLWDLSKGEEWAHRLIRFAFDHPTHPEMKLNDDDLRPVLHAINHALRGVDVDYLLTKNLYRVSPLTGMPVKRDED